MLQAGSSRRAGITCGCPALRGTVCFRCALPCHSLIHPLWRPAAGLHYSNAPTHSLSHMHAHPPCPAHPAPLQITTMVLEGWSTKLNPDIRVMDTLKDILPQNWGIRIGKTIDRCCSSGNLALAAI